MAQNALAGRWAVALALTAMAVASTFNAVPVDAQNDTVPANATANLTDAVNASETSNSTLKDLSGSQSRLRERLLENYNRGALPPRIPPEDRKESDYIGKDGVDPSTKADWMEPFIVEVGINFHRVLDVDVVTSQVDLLTWMRMIWTDKRLAWDPAEYDGIDNMWFWVESGAAMMETSEIWVPDIELWNQKQSIQTSFSNSYANVSPDGLVFWSRPGHLNPVCKFKGLHHFPFDKLSCIIELGSWSHSGKYLRPTLYDGTGYSVGGSDTAGEAFSEFRLTNVTAEVKVYPPYPVDPQADWPVLLYDVEFARSWQPYIRGYLVAQIVFNVIGFACFWLPIQSGERLGLAITAMLSAVAADLVVVAKLPSASELTWMQKFSIGSQFFAAICILESVAVAYFFYLSSSSLCPAYMRGLMRLIKRLHMGNSAQPAGKANDLKNSMESCYSARATSQDPLKKVDPSDLADENGWIKDSMDTDFTPSLDTAASLRPRDADDFHHRSQLVNNKHWKSISRRIDDVARLVIPSMYVVMLAIFLSEVDDIA